MEDNLYPLDAKTKIETPQKLKPTVIEFKPDCKYLLVVNIPVDWFPDLSRLQKDVGEKLDGLVGKDQYEVLITRGDAKIDVLEMGESNDGN